MIFNPNKSKGDSSGNGGEWDGMDEEVKFAGKKEFGAPVDYDRLAKDRHKQELATKMAVYAATEKGRGTSDREPSVSHEFSVAQDKHFRQQAERDYNVETYGANIPAATARAAFDAEFFHLQRRINHEKRALESEKELSPKDQAKAERKRLKRGEVTTPEERKHYREMEEIRAVGNKEDYGRRKEKAYREAQEAMKADRRGFKRIMKSRGHSLPKEWDDPKTSLLDLQKIVWDTQHLVQK